MFKAHTTTQLLRGETRSMKEVIDMTPMDLGVSIAGEPDTFRKSAHTKTSITRTSTRKGLE